MRKIQFMVVLSIAEIILTQFSAVTAGEQNWKLDELSKPNSQSLKHGDRTHWRASWTGDQSSCGLFSLWNESHQCLEAYYLREDARPNPVSLGAAFCKWWTQEAAPIADGGSGDVRYINVSPNAYRLLKSLCEISDRYSVAGMLLGPKISDILLWCTPRSPVDAAPACWECCCVFTSPPYLLKSIVGCYEPRVFEAQLWGPKAWSELHVALDKGEHLMYGFGGEGYVLRRGNVTVVRYSEPGYPELEGDLVNTSVPSWWAIACKGIAEMSLSDFAVAAVADPALWRCKGVTLISDPTLWIGFGAGDRKPRVMQ